MASPDLLIIYAGQKGDKGDQGIQGPQGLPGNSVAGAAITKTVSIDFGSTPVYSESFSFADAQALTTHRIFMIADGVGDELEMDNFACSAKCLVNGTIQVQISAIPGPVSGVRSFVYLLG